MTIANCRSTFLLVLGVGFMIFCSVHANAQTLLPAAQHTTQIDKITWTGSVGEPIIYTGMTDRYALTQGFQQPPNIKILDLKKQGIPSFTSNDINVFPNPFRASITIESERDGRVSVFDVLGNEVIRDISIGKGTNALDLQHLPTGKYIFVVRYSGDAAMDSRSFEAIKI